MSFIIDLVSHRAIAAIDFCERNPVYGVLFSVALLVFAVLEFVKKTSRVQATIVKMTRRVQAAAFATVGVSQLIFISMGDYNLWRSVVRVESLVIVALFGILIIAACAYLVFSELKDKRCALARKVS
jgi:hypothetical protein